MSLLKMRGAALLLLLAFPTYSSANPAVSMPEWRVLKVQSQEWGCYDLESAKKLKLFELDCQACRGKLELNLEIVKVLSERLSESERTLRGASGMLADLQTSLKSSREVLLDRQARLDRAENWAVFGGALPWVILVVAGAAFGGYVAGAHLK